VDEAAVRKEQKEQEEWDFNEVVDKDSQTFQVLAWEMSSAFDEDMVPSFLKQFHAPESEGSQHHAI